MVGIIACTFVGEARNKIGGLVLVALKVECRHAGF